MKQASGSKSHWTKLQKGPKGFQKVEMAAEVFWERTNRKKYRTNVSNREQEADKAQTPFCLTREYSKYKYFILFTPALKRKLLWVKKKNRCTCIYDWITVLYSWSQHNTVNQWYSNIKNKEIKTLGKRAHGIVSCTAPSQAAGVLSHNAASPVIPGLHVSWKHCFVIRTWALRLL